MKSQYQSDFEQLGYQTFAYGKGQCLAFKTSDPMKCAMQFAAINAVEKRLQEGQPSVFISEFCRLVRIKNNVMFFPNIPYEKPISVD
jgi:hypothetical protein